MSEALISVIIPAYNYAEKISRAVESVVAQLGEASADLLVINDGSTDQTLQVLEQLQAQHQGLFRVVSKTNGGTASVRNLGIKETKGRYLVFLDADDEMASGALTALSRHIESNPATRMVIGGFWSIGVDGKRRQRHAPVIPRTARERVSGYLIKKTIAVSNGACAMHREVFVPGNYPETFRSAEDIPVFAQVLARFPCTVLDQPLAFIYKHPTSLRHNVKFAYETGLALVDEVFAPARMPAELQDLKRSFTAQRCASLFRTFYSVGEWQTSLGFYRKALRADWRLITNWSYTRKAIKLLLRGR